jgi:toxin HigB-1
MIASFRSKALKRFWEDGDKRLLTARHLKRIEQILDRLDASVRPTDMNLPGFDFHGLGGKRRGTYSVTVTGNWRVTFRWSNENATDVHYEDTH